jgi:putative endonuclease
VKIGVYILLCRNSRYYTGSTNDLERRLVQHLSGWVKATKNLLPLKPIAFIPCSKLEDARILERKIKKMKSRKYIEELVANYAYSVE